MNVYQMDINKLENELCNKHTRFASCGVMCLYSSSVFQSNFRAGWQFCASKSPTS